MATFSGNHAELLEPRLREVLWKEYSQIPLMYPAVFNVKTSTKAFEDVLKISGFGSMTTKGEGQPVAYDDPISSDRKRTVHTVYALGFRVTMEMQDDDLYNVISQMPKELGTSLRDHQENLAWSVLNTGFVATTHAIIGGGALFASQTLLKQGGPYRNDLNPAVALSVTGIEDMLTLARTMPNESGFFTQVNVKNLIIPPALEFEAARLLETTRGEPGTDENQINTVASNRIGVRTHIVPYLTSDTAWFMTSDKHHLNWFNRKKPTFSSNKDSQTKDALFDVMYRAHVTPDDWKGAWGSNA